MPRKEEKKSVLKPMILDNTKNGTRMKPEPIYPHKLVRIDDRTVIKSRDLDLPDALICEQWKERHNAFKLTGL